MSTQNLIYRNIAEILGQDILDAKIAKGEILTAYIGFAPTGKIHLGYLLPCVKIRDLTLVGCRVAIMIADIHCVIDERKTPSHLVNLRTEYYRLSLTDLLQRLGANLDLVKFVKGSEFQLSQQYTMDLLEMSTRVTITMAQRAGAGVVKKDKHPKLGSLMYPLMQAIDENYVGQASFGSQADIELGGTDQRKIFTFALDHMVKDTTARMSYLMNPIISLSKPKPKSESEVDKMSASDPRYRILLIDNEDRIEEVIKSAYCVDGDSNCGLMLILRCVFFPLNNSLCITGDDDIVREYHSYEDFERDYRTGLFVACHVKRMIIGLICDFLVSVRNYHLGHEMVELVAAAYP